MIMQTRRNIEFLGIRCIGTALENAGLKVKYGKNGEVARVGRFPWMSKELLGKVKGIKALENEKDELRKDIDEELRLAGRDWKPLLGREETPVAKQVEPKERSPEAQKLELLERIRLNIVALKDHVARSESRESKSVSEDGEFVSWNDGESSIAVSPGGQIVAAKKTGMWQAAQNIAYGFEQLEGCLAGGAGTGTPALAKQLLEQMRDEIGVLKVFFRADLAKSRGDAIGSKEKNTARAAEQLTALSGMGYSADDIKRDFKMLGKGELFDSACLRYATIIGNDIEALSALLRK